MATLSPPSSTSFWISATALRGTITPGMPSDAVRRRDLDPGEAVAVGRDRAQHVEPPASIVWR